MNALLVVEVELSLALQEFVEFPAVSLLELRVTDPHDIQPRNIEELAANARVAFGLPLGPVQNVVETIERHGVIVARARIGGEKLDGVSQWWGADDRPYVLLADDKVSEARSRFDAAHELGHLIMHRHIQTDENDPEIYKLMESQAHRFASAFLLPEESFAADLRMITLSELQELKVKWRTSIAAMLQRCRDLGFVNEPYYRKLRTYFSSRGWNKREPLDGELGMEKPRLLSDSIRVCFDSGATNAQYLMSWLSAPTAEVEELASVPAGTLSPPSNVVRLKRDAT
ncbi:MAG: ImmA/IrrE family metallo-endopeptidase [Terricaulis sp.]